MRIQYKKPVNTNKYYIRIADGGYNPCIKGYPQDKHLTALANCCGWVLGRFNSIGLWGSCKYLRPSMACSFVKYAKIDGLKTGKKPKLGCVMCWEGGADDCGHVAIVEQIVDKNTVIVSESVYGGTAFRRKTYVNEGKGHWGMNSAYNFVGCVYNPAITMKLVLDLRKKIANKTATLDYDYDGDGVVTMKDLLLLRKSVY